MRAGTFVIAALSAAAAQAADLMEHLTDVPEGWTAVGHPDPTTPMFFRIAMTQPNQGLFEQTLYEISNPAHPRYGQHLKRDELKAMLRPAQVATEAVISWLVDAGVSREAIEDDGEWINFVAPNITTAEKLMSTEFNLYENKNGVSRIRTLEYSVPEDLHSYIDMIQPTTRFGQMRAQRSTYFSKEVLGVVGELSDVSELTDAVSCSTSITPACLRSLYKIPTTPLSSTKNIGFMAFNNFLEQYPRYNDLASFENEYATYAKGQNFTWTSFNGGLLDQSSSSDSGEANLDAQYLLAMGAPTPMRAYSTAGRGPLVPDLDQPNPATGANEPYLDFLTGILALNDSQLPHTLSTSYGEDEQSVPLSYRLNVCNLFGQLGARGVSVLFSSGDTGCGSACQTNDGKNTTRFLPIFPAACPYVTSVGGTHGVSPEQAISFSSGGFSDTWARPAWQNTAVTAYLKQLGSKWDGLYNKTGRGFPDVAAQSSNFHVIDKQSEAQLSGTSASAPTFAGIVALLNSNRLLAGKKPLGFLNPWIYSAGYKGLVDITAGTSTGCTGYDQYSGLPTPYVPGAGWAAVTGWDPVTGYGTPDYSKLLPLALNATVQNKKQAREIAFTA